MFNLLRGVNVPAGNMRPVLQVHVLRRTVGVTHRPLVTLR